MPQCTIAIVGGGPAGIAAALWARRLDCEAILFEREAELGGQLRQVTLPIPDLPGLPDITGEALRARLERHLEAVGVRPERGVEVVGYEAGSVLLADGGRVAAEAVILAPGLHPRRLAVSGAEAVLEASASALIASPPSGRVLVIGGGDRGAEAASRLGEAGIATWLVHRGERLSARPAFRARLRASGAEVWLKSRVERIVAEDGRFRVQVRRNRLSTVAEVSRILVRIGMEPAISPEWRLAQKTFGRRIRIIGDAAQRAPYRSLVTAFGTAMVALKGIALDPPGTEGGEA